jgi:hypothetical protein
MDGQHACWCAADVLDVVGSEGRSPDRLARAQPNACAVGCLLDQFALDDCQDHGTGMLVGAGLGALLAMATDGPT